jgi:hypothetical protein
LETSLAEKLSFIPPFIILVFEIILIIHAYTLNELYVITVTTILLSLSIIEIILVSREMHEHYKRRNFDRILTIKLDDFITQTKGTNVKTNVTDFIEQNPEYENSRNEIYHIVCQIMETHKKQLRNIGRHNK